MLSVDEALERILSHIDILEPEDRPLLDSLGQIAAEHVRAEMNVPDWDSSARDGFAVRAEDIRGASLQNPRILPVIGTVMAGFAAEVSVAPGTAIRIMTGAPLPSGADCVVEFEDTDAMTPNKKRRPANKVSIRQAEKAGANIKRAGEQVARGSLIVPRRAAIGPVELNILASQGYTLVKVIRRPVVAIIDTGQELANPGEPLLPSHIYNGNGLSIAAQVQRCGGIAKILGIAKDNKRSITARIRRGTRADVIVTTGGVATGDRDLVKDILAETGQVMVRQVRMVPGKAFTFALIQKTEPSGRVRLVPHFALSGNPPAAMVNFEVLVRPAILKMRGSSALAPNTIEAVMEEPMVNDEGLRRFAWVTVEKREGRYYASQPDSRVRGTLSAMAAAGGLAVIPENKARVKKGERLPVVLLDWH
jgi:molybdopterin molybdotransferase